MVITEERSATPRIGVPVAIYVVALLASIWVYKAYRPEGLLLALDIIVPVAALAWMIVRCREARRITGPASPAVKAYLWRFLPLMIAYVAAGRLVGYYEPYMHAWDCLGGYCLVNEAGGWTLPFPTRGEALTHWAPVLAAAPGAVDDLLKVANLERTAA